IDVEIDALLDVLLEIGAVDGDLVVADGQFEEDVVAVVVSGGDAGEAGFGELRGDGGALDGGAGRIGDDAADGAGDLLRGGGWDKQQQCGEKRGEQSRWASRSGEAKRDGAHPCRQKIHAIKTFPL